MLQVDEANLMILLQLRSVSHFKLVQTDGGYDVFLGLTNGEKGMVITNRVRTRPRRRVSVDAFIQHLQGLTPDPPDIHIELKKGKGVQHDDL